MCTFFVPGNKKNPKDKFECPFFNKMNSVKLVTASLGLFLDSILKFIFFKNFPNLDKYLSC